jgi:disulfide bond formation protein DsbB
MVTQVIENLIPILVLFLDIVIVLYFIGLIFEKFGGNKFMNSIRKFLKDDAVLFIFLIALVSTLGSLFYSEIMGFNPCKLCWYQRIAMYPLVVLFGMALIKKKDDVIKYSLPLVLSGGLIALYHYITQVLKWRGTCAALESGTDCALKFTFHFGYMTIPMMALTGFIGILILIKLRSKN